MSQYQLPCEHCGEVIPITATMAGSGVVCQSCETAQVVPKMGVIRTLARVSESTPGKATPNKLSSSQWSPTQGLLFVAGFLLLLSGLLGAGISYQKYAGYNSDYQAFIQSLYPDGEIPDPTNLEVWEKGISKMPVNHLWMEWRDALKESLLVWNPTRIQDLREKTEEATYYLWAFGFVASTGLLLVGASCFKWTR